MTEFARRCLYFGDQKGGAQLLEDRFVNEWWDEMMDRFTSEAPLEFAALQFKCGMTIAEHRQ